VSNVSDVKHVTVISPRTGQPIAAAHHYRGHLGGYAVRGSALALELGDRALAFTRIDALAARDVARKGLRRVPPSIEDASDKRRAAVAWKAFTEAREARAS
jgi:hypothetical protein